MGNKRIYISILFGLFVALTSFFALQANYEYHFYYMEQLQLFLWDSTYISNLFYAVAGASETVSQFLTQYFIYPYAAAIITTLLLLCIGILTNAIARRINSLVNLIAFPLLAMLTTAFLHFDHNYYITGTIAYILTLSCILGYLYISNFKLKIIASCIFTLLLYFLGGPVSILFITSILIYELLTTPKKSYFFLIPLAIAFFVSIVSVRLGMVGEFKYTLLPDMFYHGYLAAPLCIYFPWACLLLMILVACVLSKIKRKISTKLVVASLLMQLILVGIIVKYTIPVYGNEKTLQYKKLDYYARTQQWDKIIEENKHEHTTSNLLYLFYLNIALSEKNELADSFFRFDQKEARGLIINWDKTITTALVMSHLQFALRNPSEAQQIAFEGNVIASRNGSPRFYKQLVQTNLIFGAYPIAEKYISLLEKTRFYKNWATRQRRFLYNDEAVESDKLLGVMRKSIPTEDYLFVTSSPIKKLEILANTNPSYSVPIQYLGVLYLANKDIESFNKMIEKYYGTEVLPQLPCSFQEAIFINNEKNTELWEKYNIPVSVAKHFYDYRQLILKNKNNSNLSQLMQTHYGDTYWFYYMFK